ncbi:MAG: T9SS type A sorting domain-containing protein, partial [Flavobacteriaceae bacterium]|nr:T9SS type A sorting domain-containing protein [Flavobacteriaceae bacterium]
ISEVDKAALFSYYPNPVREILYFKGSENVQSVQIFDLSGKLIINQSAKTSLTQVSVAGLAKGVYVVRVKTDEQTRTFNIVKQ